MRRAPRLALLLLATACAHSNVRLAGELEREAVARPRPELDAVLAEPDRAVPGSLQAAAFPMQPGELPAVRGRVNGAPLTLLLDTGSTHVYLSGRGARAARVYVPPGDEVGIVTPGDHTPYRLCAFARLEIGPLAFGPGVAAFPLWEAAGGKHHDCIVGGSILSHFRVTFDFRRREVRLEPHGQRATAGTLFTEARIAGRSYWLLVDSGATRLGLEPWAALELGLISEAEVARHVKRPGASGGGRTTRLRVGPVEVAGLTVPSVKAMVVNTFDGEVDGEIRPAGLLGLAAFGERVWTLDYGRKRLAVEE